MKKSCPFASSANQVALEKTQNGSAALTLDPHVVCSVANQTNGHLHVELGSVKDIPCSVFRDTGATICGVRQRLVSSSDQIEGQVRCKTFGGEVTVYPLARIAVSTPYFSGDLVCAVLPDPVADLIIGNIEGLSESSGIAGQSSVEQVMMAVTTRARTAKKDLPHTPLIDVVADFGVTRQELMDLQKSDSSLTSCYDLAQSQERKAVGLVTYFFFQDSGVLYRSYEKPRQVLQQIVVPEKLRSAVLATAHDQLLAAHCGRGKSANPEHLSKNVNNCHVRREKHRILAWLNSEIIEL